ncbi:MAG: DUF5686 family protein [Flavobacteriales bacterium]|nr:DUF5686 family protein [Flavobacteriales bacterium]
MKTLLALLSLLFSIQLDAQIKVSGRAVDSETGEPLAFVAIAAEVSDRGTYSDIDGRFEVVVDAQESVVFNYIGYETYRRSFDIEISDVIIGLKRKSYVLNEVVIRPGVNPAERIIKKAIDNKNLNDPEGEESFSYDSYNKLIFTAELDTAKYNDPIEYNSLDSSNREMVDFLKAQHIFMMESASKRKFMPPNRSEETIIATRVSGLKNPEFALLGTQLQSFSFYGETVNILDVSYLSPLAKGSYNKYLFILEDTTYINEDTVFTISYRARKNKNFDAMKGQLFINTDGYALQNVIAQPGDSSSFSIKIQQMYEKVDDKKWFPVQLNTFLSMPFAKINDFPIAGIGRSYLKNIKIGEEMRAKDFTPVTLQMSKEALNQPDSLWNIYRTTILDDREVRTYEMIDSLGEAENFDRILQISKILSEGMIPMGPVNFDLKRFIRYNDYEGLRLGAGLATNDKVSKTFVLSGYYAYGFRDTHSKYGGNLRTHLYKKRNVWTDLFYENDVHETGGNQINRDDLSRMSNYYQYMVNRMDRYEKIGFRFNGRLISNLTGTFFAENAFTKMFNGYSHEYIDNELASLSRNSFLTLTTGVLLRYAPGEKLARMGNKEIRLGGRWPIVWARYSRGFSNIYKGEIEYQRIDFATEKTFKIKNIGHLTFRVNAGLTPDNLPLTLLYNAQGSNNTNYDNNKYLGIASPFTFETMHVNEFMHSRFVGVHVRHNFKHLLYKGKTFRPEIILVHNMMWGKMEFADKHQANFKEARKGYVESGLQVDKLINLNYSAFGLGVFYRYGNYAHEKPVDNITAKLSLSIAF